MADRIFPNDVKSKLDSKKVFTGINWDKVQNQIDQLQKTAQSVGDFSTDDSLDMDTSLDSTGGDDLKQFCSQVENFNDEQCADRDHEGNLIDSGDDGLGGSDLSDFSDSDFSVNASKKKKSRVASKAVSKIKSKNTKTSSVLPKKRTVIAFTSPEQLSAKAVEAAIAAGDEELKNTILAARHQRRIAIAQKIDELNNKRTAALGTVANQVRLAAAQEEVTKFASNDKVGFKAVSDLDSNEQESFIRLAQKQGFPEDYIKFMLSGGDEPSESATQIVELMKNDGLTQTAKAAAVNSMIKTANLSGRDLNYLKNYWINILGYSDPAAKEYIDALFSDKYARPVNKEAESEVDA